MSEYEKSIKLIDSNLFSGSSDRLRTAIGGFFFIESGSLTGEQVVFQSLDNEINADAHVDSYVGSLSPYIYHVGRGNAATEPAGDYPRTEVVDNGSLTLTWRYPVRFTGQADIIPDENFWKVYWAGGTFGDETYPGIFSSDAVYSDYWFETALPYSKEEINVLEGGSTITTEIEVGYDYNFYLKDYQKYATSLSSELLIPNMYLIGMFEGVEVSDVTDLDGMLAESSPSTVSYNSEIINFVSLEGEYSDVANLTNDVTTLTDIIDSDNGQVTGRGTGEIHVAGSAGVTLETLNLHEYLMEKVPLISLSSSTTDYVENALQNIMFDNACAGGSNYVEAVTKDMVTNRIDQLFPYYAKIRFSARDYGWASGLTDTIAGSAPYSTALDYPVYFAESIVNRGYSAKFLKSLKEAFGEETDAIDLSISSEDYVFVKDYYSSSQDLTYDSQVITADTTTFKTVNYLDLLKYSYLNYESQTDNCYFVGEKTISREAAMDTTGTYRYFNSQGALGVLSDALETLTDAGGGYYQVYEEDIDFTSLFNGWRTNLYGPGGSKYNETIAYRVEKIGGKATGDSKTQKVLQNFWIFNSTEWDLGDDVTIFDSQIKYGEDYTYNIYKYVIVVGVGYEFSDLALSRITNTSEDGSHCIEFYDPYSSDEEIMESPYELASGDVTVTDPYLADCVVTMEPRIKIFEIPMHTKSLKIMDYPPNQLNLNPFFFLDDSQIIGYNVNYETFVKTTYPTTISSDDEERRVSYLNANNMLVDEEITTESRSQQRYIKVYRLSEKPTSYADFNNNLISTIDLIIEDSIYTLPSAIFYDKINTNQKYYYLFRVLNENNEPGQLSEIYEAELINDGGYTYGMFNLLFEEDLEIDNFINPSITFKKFLQLQPNMSQIAFNDAEVDYKSTADSQLTALSLSTADDPIWDKTFKIRLTSKKTGKKMDLNVTYKYETNSN